MPRKRMIGLTGDSQMGWVNPDAPLLPGQEEPPLYPPPPQPTPSFPLLIGTGLTYPGPPYVYQCIAYSNDLDTWTVPESEFDPEYTYTSYGIEMSPTIIIAGHDDGGIIRSSDGINWSIVLIDNFHYGTVWDLAYSPVLGRWVAGGAGDSHLAYSDDEGLTWYPTSLSFDLVSCVIWSEPLQLFIAGGNDFYTHSIATSPNGIDWTFRANPSDGTRSINPWGLVSHPTENLLIALCNRSNITGKPSIMTSANGIDWVSRRTTGLGQSIAYSPTHDLFMAGGAWGAAHELILTSPDGIDWTLRANTPFTVVSDISWSESLGLWFCTAGGSGIYTSPDADNWTHRNSPFDGHNSEKVLCTA